MQAKTSDGKILIPFRDIYRELGSAFSWSSALCCSKSTSRLLLPIWQDKYGYSSLAPAVFTACPSPDTEEMYIANAWSSDFNNVQLPCNCIAVLFTCQKKKQKNKNTDQSANKIFDFFVRIISEKLPEQLCFCTTKRKIKKHPSFHA